MKYEREDYYNGALIWYHPNLDDESENYTRGWYADCYPYRHTWEPTTILGPFKTKKEAKSAVDKAP